MMGLQLLEESRLAGVREARRASARSAPTRSLRRCRSSEDDLWNGYPEETNAPYGLAKKMLLVQSQAYRHQYGFNVVYLLPVNLYGPARQLRSEHLPRDPGADPQVRRGGESGAARSTLWGDGSPTREFLYVDDAAEGILARRRAIRLPRAREPRLRRGDLDSRTLPS